MDMITVSLVGLIGGVVGFVLGYWVNKRIGLNNLQDANSRAKLILEEAQRVFPAGAARIFGPMPAIMERVGGRWRMYLVLLSDSRAGLHAQVDAWLPRVRQLPAARRVRWSMDIDPQEL